MNAFVTRDYWGRGIGWRRWKRSVRRENRCSKENRNLKVIWALAPHSYLTRADRETRSYRTKIYSKGNNTMAITGV